MSGSADLSRVKSEPAALDEKAAADVLSPTTTADSADTNSYNEGLTPGWLSSAPASPGVLSRNSSSYFTKDMHDMMDETPLDKLTIFDIFDNLALPSKLEKWQMALSAQKQKLARQQEKIKSQGTKTQKAVAELRKRVPTGEEQLARYRRRMKTSIDKVNKRWTETVTITTREKISFISAVLNIFISGYLIGAMPERFYWWFTVQFAYFMPIRFYTYHRKGYHYFLADLCYFVNALALLTIWLFPRSKRLFISTYCLAYGNNAVAIVMWRNSLVFHSLDKVTSLFIHVMPPVTLHCLVHLTPSEILSARFPAIYNIKHSAPSSPEHYSLSAMLTWATLPYAVWQLFYHFLITVRRRDEIAAGRPTSFTWLRKSYANTWIGRVVLGLPNALQEPAFMLIQYSYALLTIIPCPIWFWSRWASAVFLMVVFSWSVWNGANYYMDVFGKKFQKELEQMKKDMARAQGSPGSMTPLQDTTTPGEGKDSELDKIPLLEEERKDKTKAMEAEETEQEVKEGPREDAAGALLEMQLGKTGQDSSESNTGAIMESTEQKLDST